MPNEPSIETSEIETSEPVAGHDVDTRDDYDALPYLSLPISYTQPNTISALASLFGLPSPPPAHARVLELGCASGGNLIPLAARYPEGSFLGIELSGVQVANGNSRIASLGLTNVKLVCDDIAQLVLPEASFDYIICHGVYSWVPPMVQDAIFRVAATCLAENGLAAISYNVLPGWHLRGPVREILLAHAGSEGHPQERVARAREMLRLLEKSTSPDPYGTLLRAEAKRMARMPSSYILGEFLAAHNAPTTFQDFTQRAMQYNLGFLCEADLNAGARGTLDIATRQSLSAIAGSDRAKAEQYLDLLSGRPFRRSIMTKTSAGRTFGEPRAENLAGLHFVCQLRPDQTGSDATRAAFTDRRGQPIVTHWKSIARTFNRLADAYPSTVPVDTLVGTGAEATQISAALLQLLQEGRALVSRTPVSIGPATEVRPIAWDYARAEASRGLPFVTNLHHVAVEVPKVAAAVMSKLDGSNDRAKLIGWLAREIGAGQVQLPDADRETLQRGTEAVGAMAERHVNETIRYLAASAVLIPGVSAS